MNHEKTLQVGGAIDAARFAIGYADCVRARAEERVDDVGAILPGRRGTALRLSAILARARPRPEARWIELASRDPAFAVSLPLAEIAERALVVYALDGAPLPPEKGGPFRLLVPGHADECVNVKDLARLELAERAGRDTRPKDDAEHAKLHAKGP